MDGNEGEGKKGGSRREARGERIEEAISSASKEAS
jgi:hypothetical protein